MSRPAAPPASALAPNFRALFDLLPREDQAALLACAVPFRVGAQVDLTSEGDPAAGDLLLLHEGEVAVLTAGRLVTVRRAPCAMGLVTAIDEGARSATVRTLLPTRGLRIPGLRLREVAAARPATAMALARLAAGELRAAYAEAGRTEQMFDDFFSPPDARLVPGPYEGRAEMVVFVMRSSPTRLAALLPPGVRALPGAAGLWLLTLSRFTQMRSGHPAAGGRSFAYQELTPFLPCWGPRGPALFCPELYPDSHLAIVVGRELFGFPKRHARIERDARSAVVAVGGQLSLRASWAEEVPASPGALCAGLVGEALGPRSGRWAGALAGAATGLERGWPRVPVLVRRPSRDGRRRSDELVCIQFKASDLGETRRVLSPAIQHYSDSAVLHGEPVAAFAQTLTMAFERATHVARIRA